jgi:hypothetical protein
MQLSKTAARNAAKAKTENDNMWKKKSGFVIK